MIAERAGLTKGPDGNGVIIQCQRQLNMRARPFSSGRAFYRELKRVHLVS